MLRIEREGKDVLYSRSSYAIWKPTAGFYGTASRLPIEWHSCVKVHPPCPQKSPAARHKLGKGFSSYSCLLVQQLSDRAAGWTRLYSCSAILSLESQCFEQNSTEHQRSRWRGRIADVMFWGRRTPPFRGMIKRFSHSSFGHAIITPLGVMLPRLRP